jgi:Zn-dependent M28 family amino/carboxypeptidase
MKRQRAAATLAATAALALVASAAPASAKPGNNGNPNTPAKLAASVTTDGVMRHLEALQAVADANDDNRAAGTSGYEASAEYIEQQLAAAGYETWRQYFPFTFEQTFGTSLTYTVPNGPTTPVTHIPMSYSPGTPEGGVSGTLVSPTTATGCTAADWGSVDATGRIALVSRGVCSFADKSLAAAAAGAEAVIIYNNAPGDLNGTLGGLNAGHVPTTGVTQAVGQSLLALPTGTVVDFELDKIAEQRETFNLFAETSTGRDDNVVMVGAHLDSTQDGAGINDNGSGSAAILETAIQLSRAKKVNNTVRFAWWGAEELGLVGSNYYVNDLVANDPAELANIGLYLNFDMVASPNYIIGVYDADQSTYPASVSPPAGSVEAEKVFTDYFDGIGQAWVDTAYSGRSDYQAFILNGIPATGLFTGADGQKTPAEVELFGGTAGVLYDPNYHTPADDITNVNATALGIMSKAIAYATGVFAYDTSMVNDKRSAGKSGKPKPVRPAQASSEERAA